MSYIILKQNVRITLLAIAGYCYLHSLVVIVLEHNARFQIVLKGPVLLRIECIS